jgi:hypothetical protein
MIIQKGKYYKCIKTVMMNTGEITYYKGTIYKSEEYNCITNDQGYKYHYWYNDNNASTYFSELKNHKRKYYGRK